MTTTKHFYKLSNLASFYQVSQYELFVIYCRWYGRNDRQTQAELYDHTHGELLLTEAEALELIAEYRSLHTKPPPSAN